MQKENLEKMQRSVSRSLSLCCLLALSLTGCEDERSRTCSRIPHNENLSVEECRAINDMMWRQHGEFQGLTPGMLSPRRKEAPHDSITDSRAEP